MSMRVLVVDDAAIYRRIVSDVLNEIPGVEVVGTAANGRLGLTRIAALRPDLVTLDVEMPDMGGLEVLEAMAAAGLRTDVVMVSAVTVAGAELTVRALELGAFDFLTKPARGSPESNRKVLRERLVPMIRNLERRTKVRGILNRNPATASSVPLARASRRTGAPLVLVAVSTGGPAALATLIPALPRDLGAPVFVVQHMPATFTPALAASLARKSAIRVKEAAHGEVAEVNCVYLAPGGRQMKLEASAAGELIIRITDDPPEGGCRPAADYLFRSVALQSPGRAIATVLTGMGNDGTKGLLLLKRGGCFAIAQNEASCVVYGMPKEAIEAGVIDLVLPLEAIAGAIVRSLREASA